MEYGKNTQTNRPLKLSLQNSKKGRLLGNPRPEPKNPQATGFAAEQLAGFPKEGVTPKMPNKV
jgi:hypothetical protein